MFYERNCGALSSLRVIYLIIKLELAFVFGLFLCHKLVKSESNVIQKMLTKQKWDLLS